MTTLTDQHLAEVRRRIDRLETSADRGSGGARSRMQAYIDTLRRDEKSARASDREREAAVDRWLEHLHTELELAEHRAAAEFAETEEKFAGALQAQLDGWDASLDRMQATAAAQTGAGRERAEAAIADLRQRRVLIGRTLSDVGAGAGRDWRHARERVLNQLDQLKSEADTARQRQQNQQTQQNQQS